MTSQQKLACSNRVQVLCVQVQAADTLDPKQAKVTGWMFSLTCVRLQATPLQILFTHLLQNYDNTLSTPVTVNAFSMLAQNLTG